MHPTMRRIQLNNGLVSSAEKNDNILKTPRVTETIKEMIEQFLLLGCEYYSYT